MRDECTATRGGGTLISAIDLDSADGRLGAAYGFHRPALAEAFNNNALLLAACVGVEVWRKGSFFAADAIAVPLAAIGLALSMRPVWSAVRRHGWLCVGLLAVVGWWILSDVRHHAGVAGLRMPATAVAVAAGVAATQALPEGSRRLLRISVAWLGVAVAAAGLASLAIGASWWVLADERSQRLSGPFTYPSATGLFLLLCLLATLRPEANTPTLRAAQALLAMGALATDSRGTVLALVVVLVVASKDHRRQLAPAVAASVLASPLLLIGQRGLGHGWLVAIGVGAAMLLAGAVSTSPQWQARGARLRRPALGVLAGCAGVAGWLLLTQHHAVSGIDASWTERTRILRGAWSALGYQPWWGAGPDPVFISRTATGMPGIAYFAHNEPLEIALSIGLLGSAVAVLVAVVAVRRLGVFPHPGLRLVVAALLAAGLVDFVWHFPVLGLVAGIVLGSAGHNLNVMTTDPPSVSQLGLPEGSVT